MYSQYAVHEMDAQAEMEGGQIFHFRGVAQDDGMHVSTQLPWQASS